MPRAAPAPAVIADAPAKEKAAAPADKNSQAALKEKSAKEACARTDQNEPVSDRTNRRSAGTHFGGLMKSDSMRRAEAFEQARQSGAFARLAGGIQNLTRGGQSSV